MIRVVPLVAVFWWLGRLVGRWTARKPYQVSIYDRSGFLASLEFRDYDSALAAWRRMWNGRGMFPDKYITLINLDHAEAEWDGERTIVHDGLTKEEREALNNWEPTP